MLNLPAIIQSARNRVGNKLNVSAGEDFIPDEAIEDELAEYVIECNSTFGSSTASKEVQFNATAGPILPAPLAPTLAVVASGGVLGAATYNYKVTALYSRQETAPSPNATVAAVVTVAGSSVVVSWTTVQGANGYRVYGRVAGAELLIATVYGTTWTDTGLLLPNGPLPTSNSTGTGWLQDYDLATYVGTDVLEIEEVLRDDAYLGNYLEPVLIDPKTGIPAIRSSYIDQGFQEDAFQEIVAIARWRQLDSFDWHVINLPSGRALRLMPPPVGATIIVVRYTASGEAVETLPDEALAALSNAAVMCILNCMINRTNSDPLMAGDSPRDHRYWIETLERQRDMYEKYYRRALARRTA